MNSDGQDQQLGKSELLDSLLSEVTALAIKLRHPSERRRATGILPAAAFSVLRVLSSEGPLSVPQIARLKSTSRQNIQIIINRLKKAGYVQLSQNPAHKRSDLLSLTQEGLAILSQTPESQVLSSIACDCTESELRRAAELLKRIRAGFGTPSAQPSHVPVKKSPPREAQTSEESRGDDELPFNLL